MYCIGQRPAGTSAPVSDKGLCPSWACPGLADQHDGRDLVVSVDSVSAEPFSLLALAGAARNDDRAAVAVQRERRLPDLILTLMVDMVAVYRRMTVTSSIRPTLSSSWSRRAGLTQSTGLRFFIRFFNLLHLLCSFLCDRGELMLGPFNDLEETAVVLELLSR